MQYFANISHIAGISGAGLVNGLWGKKPKMLEIMPLDRINRCFEFMCSISGQEYESFIFPSHKFPIDLVKLKILLSKFVSSTS
jgi:capsular polysaccharide biosynthesis protein